MGLRRPTLLALAGLAFSCAACGEAAAGQSAPVTTNPSQIKLTSNGIVSVAVPYLPRNFNPWTVAGSSAVTAEVMAMVWPQAFVVNGSLAPQCLENISSVCEGLLSGNNPAELIDTAPQTVVYHIAPKATWSDGVPITAADFIYDWKMQLRVGDSLPPTDPVAGYRDITSIRGSNHDKTVTVVFAKPYADWQSLFTNLIPAHIGKNLQGWNRAFSGFDPKRVLSGGPFEITKDVPGSELVLSRNPHYWGPRAGVAQIVFRVEPTVAATLHALSSGRVDLAELPPGPNVTNTVLESTDLVESVDQSPVLWQLDFNLADPVVSNLDLRQAIAEAIDRHQLIANTIGEITPYDALSSNHLYAYGFGSANGIYQEPDLQQALAELHLAGYSVGHDGLARNASGQQLSLTLVGPAANPVMQAVEYQIQAQLLQLGIHVRIENVSSHELLGRVLPQGQYQLALAPYLTTPFISTEEPLYTNPTTLASGTSGPGREPAAITAGVVTRDVLGYSDPRIAQLFSEASQQLAAGASNTYNEIDSLLWSDLPSIPLFQMPEVFVHRLRVLNVSDTSTWVGPLWDAQNWTVQVHPTPTTTTTLAG